MNKQTTEQLKSIVSGAPEGATHYDECEYMIHLHDGRWVYWSKAAGWDDTRPETDTRSIADMREIIALRESNDALKVICIKLQKDLRMRGELDSKGVTVVDVSSSIWNEFCEILEQSE